MHRIIGAVTALTLLAAPAAASDAKQAVAQALEAAQAGFASPPVAADAPWLADWFGAARNVNCAILSFGADPKRITKLPREEIGRSLVDYQDRFVTAAMFVHKMVPRLITSGLDAINALPGTERRPHGKMPNTFHEIVEGPLMVLATDDAKAQNIRAPMIALRDSAAISAKLMPPNQRGRLAKLIAIMRDKAPDAQPADSQRAALTTLEKR